ncbi:insulin-like peptide receptor isoform X2 [Planococcus citri]|uniref:insulin-like peptide receptor isoform X2 n=1 Tax=Planococcus citri TaxID=170843 RepID=UPI0031F76C5A
MYDKMVTDNGHWNYCSSILRRKGRKRWQGEESTEKSRAKCQDRTLSNCCFFLGSRLLQMVMQQPRENHFKGFGQMMYGYHCTISVRLVLWFLLVFLCLNYTSLPSVYAATQSLPVTTTPTAITPSIIESNMNQTTNSSSKAVRRPRQICTSIDIRNTVDSFRQLRNCEVIEGFLQIVLMDKTKEHMFANLTFPKLREITGYMLLYRVSGLTSLAKLFPNLAIIRGHHLFINYALAVYEMLSLQELGLHSLTDISRGAVFITKNPLLCYIDTIDWERITTNGKDLNFIFENREANNCPKCPAFNSSLCAYNNNTRQSYCWTAEKCQKTCPNCNSNRCTDTGECCHNYCLGGCTGTDSDECFSCQTVFLENVNRCVDKCPDDYFRYKDRRCVSEYECYNMPRSVEEMMGITRSKPWKAFNGSCVAECPNGYEEKPFTDGDGNTLYKCLKCQGPCRKVCDAASVDSIQTAQRLRGCIVINGSLEIQIRGGNIVKELEENLRSIEEITGYLKVVRSLSLISLNFLRNLRVIKGEHLENGKYAIVVLDNPNLAELWDFDRRPTGLEVKGGRLFFHFNPKLCLGRIIELQKILKIENVTELEVAPNSNGDKVACNITELQVSVFKTTADSALITWIPYIHYEMRTLLGYVVYVLETNHRNVSMNDGRDACGIDGWKVFDVEVPDPGNTMNQNINITHIVTHLKPFQLYAYYVKTYTIATETNGAQSKIQYFITNPAMPSPPTKLKITAISSSEIVVEWGNPEQANGKLKEFVITVDIANDETLSNLPKNFCTEPFDFDKKDLFSKELKEKERKQQELVKEKERYYTNLYSSEKDDKDCQCPGEMGNKVSKIMKNDQEVQALIEFENKLHDNIYVKSVSTTPAPARNRRDTLFHVNTDKPAYVLQSNENATDLKNTTDSLKNSTKMKFYVNNTTRMYRIVGLQHFTRYSIAVQACRELMPIRLDDIQPNCSIEKIDYSQTYALETADKIDPKTIEVEILNDTNIARLKWIDPNVTNGPILAYMIQYKRMDIENAQPTSQCIPVGDLDPSPQKSYILKGLPPGNYTGCIKATTLAKDTQSGFIPMFNFIVKETEVTIIHQLLLGGLFAVCIILLVMFILFVMLRYFYPDSWYHRKLLFATVNPEYFKPIEGYDKWEISRRKIVLDSLLGIGHFGEVYEGRAKGIIQKGVTTKVAVKTLNKSPTNHRTWMSFLNEASVMKQFDTHHVVRLLGVVTKGEPLVIMELMAKGDLRTYLRSCRADVPEEERRGPLCPPPTLKEILQMSAEIADGMLYLSDKKFVHRDLAARNCMINAEGTVKIGDFGLTRDVYETDYYRKDSKGHLPVRWMAPESLRDGIFTSRSDVWSYGVVLWEMATLASLPYTGLGNGEVMPYVINGGVMEEPENCPAILSELMRACWQYKYIQRPSFSEILELLLPNIRSSFEEVSYYHTEEAKQLRASNAEAVAEDDTPYTPLRIMEDFEDFSLDSDDNEDENEVETTEARTLNEANTSSANVSVRSLPTVNGYIRRPHHNLIPLVNTKTTPC